MHPSQNGPTHTVYSAMKRNLSFVGTGISHVIVAALCLLTFGPVLSSCNRDNGPGGGLTGGESTFNITLRAGSFAGTLMDEDEMEEAATKAIPATGMHEDDMANIWVLQFNTSGVCVRSQYYASYNPSNFPVTLSNGTSQTVAFVANTFDANLFKGYAGSWSAFQALTKNLTAENGLYTGTASDHYLIISGIYKGDITAAGLPAAVQMKRAVAKVKFTWSLSLPNGDAFTAKSLKICRVPRAQAYIEPSAALYPTTVTDTITYTATTNPAAGTTTWYVTENTRGTGTGSTSFDKNAVTAQNGQGVYCTYINLQGDYTFGSTSVTIGVSYKFYLGADVTSDYNVRRNNIYDLTVRITGANVADQRISMTSASGGWGLDTDNPGAGGGNVTFN